jgi:hypothetical protein
MLFPYSSRKLAVTHMLRLQGMPNAARTELKSAVLALRLTSTLPGYVAGRTMIRMYSMSTYATNAVNDYARNATSFKGANGEIMAELCQAVRFAKVRAFWTSSTDPALQSVHTLAIDLKLKRGEVDGVDDVCAEDTCAQDDDDV